jgi:hypothetical protein
VNITRAPGLVGVRNHRSRSQGGQQTPRLLDVEADSTGLDDRAQVAPGTSRSTLANHPRDMA